MSDPTRFCNLCGKPTDYRIPDGDHLPRHVCVHCGNIQYRNPKVIVGIIPEWEDGRIVMCKRAIQPRLGLWTFPAGFLEMSETSGHGAAREAREEALCDVEPLDLFMVINVPYVSQVYLIHRGRVREPLFGPTPESSEVVLMREDEIPWDDIAFPTIWHSLKRFFEDRARGAYGLHTLDLTHKPLPPRRAEVPAGNI
jgi:ADP-ribose pyrophosphatase YjhB (NUDIX family)